MSVGLSGANCETAARTRPKLPGRICRANHVLNLAQRGSILFEQRRRQHVARPRCTRHSRRPQPPGALRQRATAEIASMEDVSKIDFSDERPPT